MVNTAQLDRCACGAPATLRMEVEVEGSLRGMATRWERGCPRCIDRLARQHLANGARALTVERRRTGGE